MHQNETSTLLHQKPLPGQIQDGSFLGREEKNQQWQLVQQTALFDLCYGTKRQQGKIDQKGRKG